MAAGYHEGELAAQRRGGVADAAARLERLPRPEIPPAAFDFLREQTLAVIATADASGRMWASPLAGLPGFLRATGPRTLRAASRPAPGDALATNLEEESLVGLLAIQPRTRRRMRVNGRGRWISAGELEITTEEVYANCPKYISRREPDLTQAAFPAPAQRSGRLDGRQQALISSADTLFIATRHPERGADASHRGGEPGFVRLRADGDGPDILWLPDYPGNNMLNTLGNLLVEPRAGLLFLDFELGDALQLTGRGEPRWEEDRRELLFRVDEAVELPGALGHRWRAL